MEIGHGIRVVLMEPSHPGNIGAVARAMKTMGLHRLVLVRPKVFPAADATARAAGADDILHYAFVCEHLEEALSDTVWVAGTTARKRHIAWPEIDPKTLAGDVCRRAQTGDVAIVFGRENAGLTNEELDRCHAVVRIPANPAFSSLNLGAAVQIIGYEIAMCASAGHRAEPIPGHIPVSSDEMEGFYTHLREVLIELEYLDPAKPKLLMRRLRKIFNRVQPDRSELNILRGILAAVQSRGRRDLPY